MIQKFDDAQKQRLREYFVEYGEASLYLLDKLHEISKKTGLILHHDRKNVWSVDKKFRTVKRGTIAVCLDYMLNTWKKKR